MKKEKTAFVALNHRCWFSKKYTTLSVKEVIAKDPMYIRWCIDNLKHLRFHSLVKNSVNDAIQLLR